MFAEKIFKSDPELVKQVDSGTRISEEEIVRDMSKVAQVHSSSKRLRIVTVGDDRVCEKCAKWQGKEVSIDGSSRPSLQNAIDDGFLHFGCRCSLQEISTSEIPLNPMNPRFEARKAANPLIYNTVPTSVLVFN